MRVGYVRDSCRGVGGGGAGQVLKGASPLRRVSRARASLVSPLPAPPRTLAGLCVRLRFVYRQPPPPSPHPSLRFPSPALLPPVPPGHPIPPPPRHCTPPLFARSLPATTPAVSPPPPPSPPPHPGLAPPPHRPPPRPPRRSIHPRRCRRRRCWCCCCAWCRCRPPSSAAGAVAYCRRVPRPRRAAPSRAAAVGHHAVLGVDDAE